MDGESVMSLWGDACRFCQQARWLIVSILTLVFVLWGIWGWREVANWYEDNSPVMAFGNGEAAQSHAYPSEVIVFYQNVKKFRSCEGEAHYVVTGQCGHIVVRTQPATLSAGFEGRLTLPIQIPYEAIPGPCGFQIHVQYQCNPFDWILQRQVFESKVIPFTVREYDQ